MKILKIHRVRVGQLYTIAHNTIEICKNFESLSKPMQLVLSLTTNFSNGIQKNKISAVDRKVKDDKRDALLKGFIKAVKAERSFPHEDILATETVEKINGVVNKYGTSITRLGYAEETAATDNLLAEMEQIDTNAIAGSDLLRWLPHIKEANNSFKNVDFDFIEDKVENAEIKAAYKVAPELKEALENLYAYMFSNIFLNDDKEMQKAYLQLEEMIEEI